MFKDLTPLIEANHFLYESAYIGNLEGVILALENGADVDAGAGEAIGLATKNGHFEVVKYLIENGSKYFSHAIFSGNLNKQDNKRDIINYLYDKSNGKLPTYVEDIALKVLKDD